jgi:predicted MPP superfamily phosphohydrolase
VLLAALAVDAFWLEPSSLRLAQYDVPAPAPALRGLRIAVIADLHGGSPYIGKDKIDAVVAMTNAAHPDLVLMAGDYVAGVPHIWGGPHISIEIIAAHLKALKAPLGVYAVLGNHDNWTDPGRVAAALRGNGIKVLDNAHLVLPHSALTLVGIGDQRSHADNVAHALAGIAAGTQALCFTHAPDLFAQLPSTCALTVAGHTHGGQVVLPFLGRPIAPTRFGYDAGIFHKDGKTLFVSTGIGTSIMPVRFGVPPEISLLSLQ